MDEVIVRKMKAEDWIELKKNVYTEMEESQVEENVRQNVKNMEVSNEWIYLVAEKNGEILGTTYLKIGDTSPINKHLAGLYSVVVSEEHRGQGVCKALINESKKIAKASGAEILTVSVREGTLADNVYQKLGFKTYGNLKNGIKDGTKYFNLKLMAQEIL